MASPETETTKGQVTIEKQHITLGVAAVVLVFAIRLAFGYGQTTGKAETSAETQFANIQVQLTKIEKAVTDSETDRKEYQRIVGTQLGDVSGKVSVLTQRVDDLTVQVQNKKIINP